VSPVTLRRLRRAFLLLTRISPRLAARVFLNRFALPGRRRLETLDEATLAKAHRSRLRFGTGTLEVYEWEPAAPRGHPVPTVVILHGWGSHAPRFSAFVEAVLARGWRALAFDAPGHGRSTGRGSSLMQFRSALDAVVEAYGPAQAFIAHSLGALALALRLGDPRTTAQTHAAVLISMPRDAAYLMELYLDALGAPPRVRALVRKGFTRRYGLGVEELSGFAQAARIGCPVLVVHDEDDESVPVTHGRDLHGLLPTGELHLTRGLGHNRLLRDAATVDAAIRFLARALSPGHRAVV
jgi:pimeloyl-ACP methyl ester carboxylesterase